MLGTMRPIFILSLFCLVGWTNSQKCPAKYKRFTLQHTFCLAPSSSCQISRTGISQQDKELILRLHNQFRSKVAMGNEHRSLGSSLPQAADMMQLEWDDELAAIAQKWTENCYWGHDCHECRAVESFGVGQNLATEYGKMVNNEPDWTWAITDLYDEVKDYHRSWLDSFIKHPGPKTGHFTQLIWSRSWRIGCGYSYYKQGGIFHRYYACNYGPGGNVEEQPVYTPGKPCSACPTNTQCSIKYPGLCKMNNPNTAPAFKINQNGLLFYCGNSKSASDCRTDASGDGSWKTVQSVGGNYESIVLRGGQSNTLTFTTPIKPHGKGFCIHFYIRKGPLDASRGDASNLQANYKIGRSSSASSNLHTGTTSFMDNYIDLGWGQETKLTLIFSVPSGAAEHALDIRTVEAYDGSCESRNG